MSTAADRARAAQAERMAKRKPAPTPRWGGQALPQPYQQYVQPQPQYVQPQPSGPVTQEVPVVSYDIRTVMGPATEMTSAFNTETRMVDIKINLGGNTGDVVYVPLQAQISYPVYYQIPKQVLRPRQVKIPRPMVERRVVTKMVPKVIQVEESYEIETAVTEMKTFFMNADISGDGMLSYAEWEAANRAKGYDAASMKQMFVSCTHCARCSFACSAYLQSRDALDDDPGLHCGRLQGTPTATGRCPWQKCQRIRAKAASSPVITVVIKGASEQKEGKEVIWGRGGNGGGGVDGLSENWNNIYCAQDNISLLGAGQYLIGTGQSPRWMGVSFFDKNVGTLLIGGATFNRPIGAFTHLLILRPLRVLFRLPYCRCPQMADLCG